MKTLLRIAQADSYALSCEYIDEIKYKDLIDSLLKYESYHSHPSYHNNIPGHYSDDTQMSIAVSEYLIDLSNNINNPIINYFFNAFKRDPIDGYSRNFQKLLNDSQSVEELKTNLITNSDSNGAAMRSVPIGFIKDISYVVKIAEEQAKVTHNTFGGIISSIMVALLSHYYKYSNDDFTKLLQYLVKQDFNHQEVIVSLFELFINNDWTGRLCNKNPLCKNGLGLATVHSAITILKNKNSLLDMMSEIICNGGDTDSVASIVWGIASHRYNDKLPDFFESDLRNDTYGFKYLIDLNSKLDNLNQNKLK